MRHYGWLRRKYGGDHKTESMETGAENKQVSENGYAYLDIFRWGADGLSDYVSTLDTVAELSQIEDELKRRDDFSEEDKERVSAAITSRLEELGVY